MVVTESVSTQKIQPQLPEKTSACLKQIKPASRRGFREIARKALALDFTCGASAKPV